MRRWRLGAWTALAIAAIAAGVGAWQGMLWHRYSHDNAQIRAAIAHESGEVTPLRTALPVLFAQGYAAQQDQAYRGAITAYQAIWARTHNGRHDPRGLAPKTRYNLGNLYVARALVAFRNLNADQGRAMVQLAKQAYRDALRKRPGYWAAKHNFAALERLSPDQNNLSKHKDANYQHLRLRIWSALPDLPPGAP